MAIPFFTNNTILPKPSYYEGVFLSQRYINLDYYPHNDNPNILGAYLSVDRINRFFSEGCLSKSLIMGIGGGVLGMLFGTFFFTLKPMDVDTTLPFMGQVKQQYKGFSKEVLRTTKNFSKIGFVYSMVECFLEKERARRDIKGAIYSGCITGAILAYKGGPVAMLGGCSMFGAFSGIMEKIQPFSNF